MSNLNFGLFGQNNNFLGSDATFTTVPTGAWNTKNFGMDVDKSALRVIARADNTSIIAPINLPDGATVTEFIVYGSNSAKQFDLYRSLITNGNTEGLGRGELNTPKIAVKGLIDNTKYYYTMEILNLDLNEEVYGGQIFFTPKKE